MINYHIHTNRCGHALGVPAEYVQAARAAGLAEMGFADHIPMYFLPAESREAGIAMSAEQLPEYIADIQQQQKDNPDMIIRLGIEADFAEGHEAELQRLLNAYPFDYVLGSVHFMGEWGVDTSAFIDEYNKRDLGEVYTTYFDYLQKAAKSGFFDIMAHPDLVKKFGFRPEITLSSIYEKTVQIIKESDVTIEINTSGLRAPAREIYPCREFLELCYRYKVPVTIGTDAHHPDQIVEGIPEALELLKDLGYTEVATFEKRKRTMKAIT